MKESGGQQSGLVCLAEVFCGGNIQMWGKNSESVIEYLIQIQSENVDIPTLSAMPGYWVESPDEEVSLPQPDTTHLVGRQYLDKPEPGNLC